jgi:ribonuclease E
VHPAWLRQNAPGEPELEIVHMLDNEPQGGDETGATPADTTPTRRTRRSRSTASQEVAAEAGVAAAGTEEVQAPVRRTRARRAAATSAEATEAAPTSDAAAEAAAEPAPTRTRRRRSAATADAAGEAQAEVAAPAAEPAAPSTGRRRAPAAATVLFMAPEAVAAAAATGRPEAVAAAAAEAEPTDEAEAVRASRRRRSRRGGVETVVEPAAVEAAEPEVDHEPEEGEDESTHGRRRRGRRGRGRGRGAGDEAAADAGEPAEAEDEEPEEAESGETVTRRRRRRRRGGTGDGESTSEDGVVTIVKVRQPRAARDEVQGVTGSTRLEAKRQRRRDGREQRRTRPPILSESEFLARREAVDRTMVVREHADRTQIAVLEDGILVEHYVSRASAGSMVGNVYLGKVQNVLPSMEAAFIDIGRGRNAVLYAGEVNWDTTGLEGRARSIEQALKSGDSVLVQVTKDPIGHKGARLTSHVALSGRHLVYVPHGNASGISRKLPDNERKRLRDILKSLVPESAGVIVRTAAEGAAEDELERDVIRLQAQWGDIQAKAAEGGAPVLLYEEPDLVIRVVRDLFNEDFREVMVQGSAAYEMVEMYLKHVSPDLVERLHRYAGTTDVFAERRIDEQILKGLDRKVFLPSGGYLVIDRTEAMTVIDVNTGKYTGTGGNLEETVTRNNLEAAEEIVRQLRLRDLGGIVVIDFIDMVLESNRELVLRRLTECLGRDRTKHQVTEITSLGLVQMTRKRIGQGLLEAFSETCEHCKGRGLLIHTEPVPEKKPAAKATAVVAAASESTGRRRGRSAAPAVEVSSSQSAGSAADDDEVVSSPWEPDEEPVMAATADEADESDDFEPVPHDEEQQPELRRRGRRGGTRRRTRTSI